MRSAEILKGPIWQAFVLGAMLVLGGCGKETADEAPEVVRPIKTVVAGGSLAGRVTFPGRVQAAQRVVLSFRVSGRLMELPIIEGQEVDEGQLLARLDPRDFEIAVEEARAAFVKAESDFVRYQRLYEKDAVPLSDLDLRRAQRDVAKAHLDQAETNLEYTYLKAPFSGRLGEKYVDNFEDVQAKEPIVSLHNVSVIEIVIDVPEYLLAKRRDNVEITAWAVFETISSTKYDLTFKEASAEADPTTQTYKVTLTMPQPGTPRILPGMTAQVHAEFRHTIEVGSEPNFTVPATAILEGPGGKQYVWVVQEPEMTVTRREVTVGEVTGTASVRILGGLKGGERIAVAAVNRLREGMKVRLMEE